jgi:1-acyl-sn-glycerol-3-phosphate acyltransferase
MAALESVGGAKRVRQAVPIGPWYTFCVILLRPWLQLLTKRDWRGRANVGRPGEGLVVAINHTSWFDPLASAHFIYDAGRPPRYLGKVAVFNVPLIGRILRGAGQIPVYRETREAVTALTAAIAAVEAGECVAVYPEATITRDPDLWPMTGKTGAARISLVTGCPVVPLAVWGAQEVIWPYKREFRILPRKTMHAWTGAPVDLDDLRGRPLDAETLRLATDRIMAALTGLLEQIRGEPAPAVRFDRRRINEQKFDPDEGES